MKNRRNTLLIIVLIVFIPMSISLISVYFKESISNSVTVVTAIIGAVAIWYQLKKDHDISKADFIFSLNNTFHENNNIEYIYTKLKQYRDLEDITFTEEDGRKMGDYIMYFEIMNYLIDQRIVTIEMVNKLFANKFFIFVNNPDVQKYQLIYSAINAPILELYSKWYNYRLSHKDCLLYAEKSLHVELDQYFTMKKDGKIEFNKNKTVNYT